MALEPLSTRLLQHELALRHYREENSYSHY